MVVCQYFMRGQCRFGDNCRNEHPINPRPSGFGNQSWNNNNAQSKPASLLFTQDTMKCDLTSDKPIWPLSCYGPAKYEPNLIGELDESMEELRVRAVLALKAGNSNEYTSYESSKIQAADQAFTNARNNLSSAYQAATNQSNKKSSTTSTSTSAFGHSPTNSTFGQSAFGPSAFGRPTSAPQSAFGSTTSTFSKPTTTGGATFGQSSFGQPQQQSAFGSVIKPASGAFSAFANAGSSPFAAAATANQNPNQDGASGGGGGAGGFAAFAGQPSAFGAGATNTTSGSSIGSVFGGGGGTTTSGFGAPGPVFGQPSQTQPTFGALQSQPTSVFGQPSQPQTHQQQSAFGAPITQPQSAFSQPQAQTQSAFGTLTTQPQSAFGAPSAFGSTSGASTGANNPLNAQPMQSSVFTPLSNPINPLNASASPQSTFNSNPLRSTPPPQPFNAFRSGPTAPNPFISDNNSSTNVNTNPFASTTTTSSFFPSTSTPPTTTTAAPTAIASTSTTHPLTNPITKPNFSLLLTKVQATPGLTPYDSFLPPDYAKILPEGVLEAFRKEKFEFGKVPDWVPPIEMR